MITITIDNKALDALERMDKAAPDHVQRHAEQRGERYHSSMREATPEGRGERPGRLKAAWQLDKQAPGVVRLHNDEKYLRYVVLGRGPVVAKPGKVLRFVIDGEVLYRHRVGPAAPNAFIDKTLQYEATHDQADAEALARTILNEFR